MKCRPESSFAGSARSRRRKKQELRWPEATPGPTPSPKQIGDLGRSLRKSGPRRSGSATLEIGLGGSTPLLKRISDRAYPGGDRNAELRSKLRSRFLPNGDRGGGPQRSGLAALEMARGRSNPRAAAVVFSIGLRNVRSPETAGEAGKRDREKRRSGEVRKKRGRSLRREKWRKGR
ncbi:hypothetical protein TIFTF001_021715 [Ficus carica]|uniref:Uncharacterized protein n=1 Tax=Ficus carica TaxID=3494 RepID=A0AA88DEW3_FICCA|nr:hypothetical protein TIFTF001_021715 [Ficus carica]